MPVGRGQRVEPRRLQQLPRDVQHGLRALAGRHPGGPPVCARRRVGVGRILPALVPGERVEQVGVAARHPGPRPHPAAAEHAVLGMLHLGVGQVGGGVALLPEPARDELRPLRPAVAADPQPVAPQMAEGAPPRPPDRRARIAPVVLAGAKHVGEAARQRPVRTRAVRVGHPECHGRLTRPSQPHAHAHAHVEMQPLLLLQRLLEQHPAFRGPASTAPSPPVPCVPARRR